jgi:transmembrane sensor
MVDKRRNPFESNQLQREAIEWFARMRGDEAERHRAGFERWLARGAVHRSAYNRIANLYSDGKRVNWENLPPPQPVRGAAKRVWMMSIGVAALVGFVAWRIVAVPILPGDGSLNAPPVEIARKSDGIQYATRLGEIRTVKLSDGSKLTIDTDTLVTIDFGQTARHLRLEHGRARFEVAHEARPFVVDAGDAEVIARGTVFDVSYLEDRRVKVQLLHGAVDVTQKGSRAGAPTLRLQPGGAIVVEPKAQPRQIQGKADAPEDWPKGMMEFRRAPLADVIAQVNRYAVAKVRLADPSLGKIEVSGVFRIDDADALAGHLAQLLGLRVERTAGEIILTRLEK